MKAPFGVAQGQGLLKRGMEPGRINTDILLRQIGEGDASAKGQLLEALYRELRGLADRLLSRERSDHLLQPTALVHEAFLKLVDQTSIGVHDAAHFKAIAARSMRQVLVDYARSEAADKRGGGLRRLTLTGAAIVEATRNVNAVDLIALEEALIALAAMDARKALVVELRFFGGLSIDEVADELGVVRSTVADDWKVARAWLAGRLEEGPSG